MDKVSMEFYGDADGRRVEMLITGDGSIEHYLETFRAFLMASGFHPADIDDELDEINSEINCRETW